MKRATFKGTTQERLRHLFTYDEELGRLRWKATNARRIKNGDLAGTIVVRGDSKYRMICVDYKPMYEHQLIWLFLRGEWATEIDHIDGDGLNNNIDNLRPCTSTQNKGNQGKPKNNTSGFKGAFRGKNGVRWRSQIQFQGKCYFLGLFNTPEEAHQAYCKAAIDKFGAFARFE